MWAEFAWSLRQGAALHVRTGHWRGCCLSENSWVSGHATPCSFIQ